MPDITSSNAYVFVWRTSYFTRHQQLSLLLHARKGNFELHMIAIKKGANLDKRGVLKQFLRERIVVLECYYVTNGVAQFPGHNQTQGSMKHILICISCCTKLQILNAVFLDLNVQIQERSLKCSLIQIKQ